MYKVNSLIVAGLMLALLGSIAQAQDKAVFQLDKEVVRVNMLGDVKLIRTAKTPKEVKIIKTREYQTSTCTEYSTHEYLGTCYTRTRIPNPRVCNFFETYTTYGPFGSIHVQRRCISWTGGGTSTISEPYSCMSTREVCSKSAMKMQVGTIEFKFKFKKMHKLASGEIEEYLLTEENSEGRTSWDFRILDSNGRAYKIKREGSNFELRRD